MKALASTLIAGLLIAASPASADDVAEFFRGKRINLVIGYGSGGGYDTYARLLARFIGEHIPGKPTVIAQNMPGAGSRGAGNWLYNVAPKDGTVISMLSQATPTDQALGQPGISSQMIDNINASIHVRALLTDVFIVDEILKAKQ